MCNKECCEGGSMSKDEKKLIVETLGEMRELKGEMREFKEHVIHRVEILEKKEAEQTRERISVFSMYVV